MRLALFEPDIPQNTAAILRTAACLGVPVDIIEPCGFVFSDKHLKRVGMDYLDMVVIARHVSWAAFLEDSGLPPARLVLLSTHANTPYTDFRFERGDILVLGRESAGVTDAVRQACAARVGIPMVAGARSLNVAVAAAMVLGEALRQT